MSDRMNQNKENSESAFENGKGSDNNEYSFWAEQVANSRTNAEKESKNIDYTQSNDGSGIESETKEREYTNVGNETESGSNQSDESTQNGSNTYVPNFTYQEPKKEEQGQNIHGYHPNYSNVDEDANKADEQTTNDQAGRKGNRKIGKGLKIALAAACSGVIAGACFIGVISLYRHFTGTSDNYVVSIGNGNVGQIGTTTVLDEAAIPDTDVTQVYKSTLPSMVAIDSTVNETIEWFGQTFEQESPGSGSGIIVGETDTELLIATNNHVVDGASSIVITFIDGTTAEGITKGTDASADLAVVAVDITTLSKDTLSKIKVASLGDSDNVLEGEMAIAIGNALGYGQSITVGYISAVNRTVEFDTGSMQLLQTDAAINPGNSGGALINTKGEVIGINSAKLAADTIEGIGYAIPISYAYPILSELMSREIIKEEDQGYLGVYITDITEDISEAYGWPMGVYVRGFGEGSAAQEAGIQERDIITGVEDIEVTTASALKEKVISYKYGTTITVTVQRNVDGTFVEKQIKVTLGKNPEFTEGNTSNKNQE